MRTRWHTLDKAEKKLFIERAIQRLLNRDTELLPHQRQFLCEALGCTTRGLFELALCNLRDAYSAEAERFAHVLDRDLVLLGSNRNLSRALSYLEGSPTQEHAVFG